MAVGEDNGSEVVVNLIGGSAIGGAVLNDGDVFVVAES
jgi:hypothetical protein